MAHYTEDLAESVVATSVVEVATRILYAVLTAAVLMTSAAIPGGSATLPETAVETVAVTDTLRVYRIDTVADVAGATDDADGSQVTLVSDVIVGNTLLSPLTTRRMSVSDTRVARDAARIGQVGAVGELAAASDGVYAAVKAILYDAGNAVSSIGGDVHTGTLLVESATAYGSMDSHQSAVLESQCVAESATSVTISASLADTGEATDAAADSYGNIVMAADSASASDAVAMRGDYAYTVNEDAQTVGEAVLPLSGCGIAVNTSTSALGLYTQFFVNSVCGTPDGVFAATAEGICRVDDYTTPVDAFVQFAKTDFRTPGEKRVDEVWLGVEGGDDLTLAVDIMTGGAAATYTYPIESRVTTNARNTRFITGRGAISRYWGIRIQGSNPFNIINIVAKVSDVKRSV